MSEPLDLTPIVDWTEIPGKRIGEIRGGEFVRNGVPVTILRADVQFIAEPPQLWVYFSDGSIYRFYEDYLDSDKTYCSLKKERP